MYDSLRTSILVGTAQLPSLAITIPGSIRPYAKNSAHLTMYLPLYNRIKAKGAANKLSMNEYGINRSLGEELSSTHCTTLFVQAQHRAKRSQQLQQQLLLGASVLMQGAPVN